MVYKRKNKTAGETRSEKETVLPKGRKPWVALMLCSLTLAAVYLLRVFAGVAGAVSGSIETEPAALALVVVLMGSCLLLVFLMARMLVDAFVSQTPFSHAQARRLAMLGFSFFLCALAEVLVAIGLPFASYPAEMATVFGAFGHFGAPSIVMLLIVAAFVSFYLSYIFNYGTFLQCFYDETV